MMGRLKHEQEQLFYEFRLDEVVPDDHLVRGIAGVLDLSWVRGELASYYSPLGRPSIDPLLMIRMLIVGYVFAIRSERLLCREVQVNLAYRWFCGLSIGDKIPDHSAFSRARNERFRDSDIFRRVFERVVQACINAGLVGGEGLPSWWHDHRQRSLCVLRERRVASVALRLRAERQFKCVTAAASSRASGQQRAAPTFKAAAAGDFCNKICHHRTHAPQPASGQLVAPAMSAFLPLLGIGGH